MKRILVLCQRKRSNESKWTENVIKTNETIKEYMDKIYPMYQKNYTFLSSCLDQDKGDPDCADFKFDFNPINQETINFIQERRSSYDIIILNTCPLPLFNPFIIYGLCELLVREGHFFILAINEKNISKNTTELYTYYFSHHKKILLKTIPENSKISETAVTFDNIGIAELMDNIFNWIKINDEIFFVKKSEYSNEYIIPLFQYLCKYYNPNLFKILPYHIQLFSKKVSKYCIEQNRGNIKLANEIINSRLF